jgi:hypothetical protein
MKDKIEVGDTVKIKNNHPYGGIPQRAVGIVVRASGDLRGDWQVKGKYTRVHGGVFELGFFEQELTLVHKAVHP